MTLDRPSTIMYYISDQQEAPLHLTRQKFHPWHLRRIFQQF